MAADVALTEGNTYEYCKGGVKPAITVTVDGKLLNEGVDYTVTYKDNNKITDRAMLTVKGKGNYAGSVGVTYKIITGTLEHVNSTAGDVEYAFKPGICKPAITMTDATGTKLAAGKDYSTNYVYTYVRSVTVSQKAGKNNYTSVERKAGDKVDLKNDIIPAKTEISVRIEGLGNYKGSSRTLIFRYVEQSLVKAKVTVPSQCYSGKPIEISKDDIKVILNGKTLSKYDYEIVGYTSNIKKGTGTITLRGTGDYGGYKTVQFKILSYQFK